MIAFLDTNVILRHLLADHPTLSPAARETLRQVEDGELEVWTSDLVIAEIVFVLSNRRTYGFERTLIRDVLLPLIDLPGVSLPIKDIYPRVFEIYINANIDFIDAYHAAMVERQSDNHVISFDTDFDRVPSVARIEPSVPSASEAPPD